MGKCPKSSSDLFLLGEGDLVPSLDGTGVLFLLLSILCEVKGDVKDAQIMFTVVREEEIDVKE